LPGNHEAINYLAPIVLFVYNRPDHTRQTLDALAANTLADESELFIFSDAPKNEPAAEKVRAVRSYIKTVRGFKSVHIVERETNWGLAKSIIEGVTEIVNQYGKVIVLEDDIVTSPYFLKFMNGALDFYENEKKVWHISGWNYPVKTNGIGGAFFWRTMSCWGWATWRGRWRYFEKDVDKLVSSFTEKDIYRFNINGADNMWGQVLANKSGAINTWAIFWYAAVFRNDGLCLNPAKSFVRNIGFDATGIHCGNSSAFSSAVLSEKEIDFTRIPVEEDELAVKRIVRFYKTNNKPRRRNIIFRIINKTVRVFLGR
jgi:hypothetical protein